MVLLLHGYGAPGTDLVPLWRELALPPAVRFAFPEAPMALDSESLGLPPGYDARAFWDIDLLALQLAIRKGQLEAIRRHVPPGLADARAGLARVVAGLERHHGVDPSRLVIGGFSQGAMLACDYAFRSETPLAGLLVLSGMVLCEDDWTACLPNREGLRVFQSHGLGDPLLPVELGQRLRELMLDAGLEVEWVEFRGGHGIGAPVLERLSAFLRRQLEVGA